MKNSIIVFFAFLSSVCCGQNQKNYIVKADTGDTLFYDNVKLNYNWRSVKCSDNSKEIKYEMEDLKSLATQFDLNGLFSKKTSTYTKFEVKNRNPEKMKGMMLPHIIMIQNGNYKILFLELVASNSIDRYYYLFEGEKFILEITRKNYLEIVPKYFSTCTGFINKIKDDKFLDMYDHARALNYKCE